MKELELLIRNSRKDSRTGFLLIPPLYIHTETVTMSNEGAFNWLFEKHTN